MSAPADRLSDWWFKIQAASGASSKENADAPEGGRRGKLDMSNVVHASIKAKPSALSSEVKLVTPQMARHLRDTANFERQRNISPANVDRLSAEMAAGRFTPGTQIYICVLPDGSERIVNGNHTLESVHACGVPQLLTITRKAVKDLDEAGRIYAVFDIQKVRSWRDSLRAVGGGDEIGNSSKMLSAVLSIYNRFGQASTTTQAGSRIEVLKLFEEYKECGEIFNAACAGAPRESSQLVRRAAVCGVALETIRYQPTAAVEFWRSCARDDGLSSGMPEKALLHWLRGNKVGSSTTRSDHAKAAALAWNAYFRGESRLHIKPRAMASFFLLGTPWANGLGD